MGVLHEWRFYKNSLEFCSKSNSPSRWFNLNLYDPAVVLRSSMCYSFLTLFRHSQLSLRTANNNNRSKSNRHERHARNWSLIGLQFVTVNDIVTSESRFRRLVSIRLFGMCSAKALGLQWRRITMVKTYNHGEGYNHKTQAFISCKLSSPSSWTFSPFMILVPLENLFCTLINLLMLIV